MNKFYVIAAAALVSLASCTKSEVVNPNSNKAIAFTAVAGKAATKAPIEGTVYSLDDPSFGMFAYWNDTTSPWGVEASSTFMNNVEIKADRDKKIWAPESNYYWPISGKITFIGYSPYAVSASASYDNAEKKLTIASFDASADHDLLWATAAEDKTYNDASYTYATGSQSTELGVPVVFHHALSQVQFWVKSDVDIFTVKNITVKSVKNAETLTVTNNVASWSTTSTTTADFVASSASQAVTSEYAQYGKSLLLTPQALTDVTISITYSQTANTITSTSTKEFSAIATDVFDSWGINKKYIYYIDLTANKVQFSPSVVDWDAAVNESYIWLTAPKTGVINATTTLANAASAITAFDETVVTAATLSTDGKTVTYTVAPNTTTAKREGYIKLTVNSKPVTIKVVQD